MNVAVKNSPDLASRLVNGVLSIKPLANFAKYRARQMMIKRAEKIGVPWTQTVKQLQLRNWEPDLAKVQNPQISYPDYYLTSFHAYEEGNMSLQAAFEVEPAAYAVHAKLWQSVSPKGDMSPEGDAKLRQSYHDVLKAEISHPPKDIADLGCGVGMSTFALQEVYPHAKITGVDLSPYFLAVANYNLQRRQSNINFIHAPAEATGLADASFDLVSMCLICHELPQSATKQIFAEAFRLLRPGGYLTIMDMNPDSEAFKKMPPYVLTLLKSTEPYLDRYFSLDIEKALVNAGFQTPSISSNSPRHRTVIARVSKI